MKSLANVSSPRAVALFNRGERPALMQLNHADLTLLSSCVCVSAGDLGTKRVVVERNCGVGEVYSAQAGCNDGFGFRTRARGKHNEEMLRVLSQVQSEE